MLSNQFYSVINPIIGEFVLVHFIERTDSFFDAILLEYPYRAMMSYQDATKKRKIYNWSKVVPLNKDMVARVDEVDINAKIVQISIAHLDEEFKESLSLSDIQDKLMIQFNENKILDHFINSVSVVNQINKNQIWSNLIYYIDNERRNYNDDNDEEITLWKYFTININMMDKWCELCKIDNQICESIKSIYSKRFNNKCKYVTKIGIISPNGINITKNILKKLLDNITYNYTLNYDSTPYYLFESYSDDSNKIDHEKIISELKKYSEIFIKIDYIAKEI
jgi:translation initiation factor 2 alpha subunit (eIF-2alpha)